MWYQIENDDQIDVTKQTMRLPKRLYVFIAALKRTGKIDVVVTVYFCWWH